MRLIDVTDLKKFIKENVCAIGDDHLLLVAGDDGRWHEALPLVKTAYSVDKVVEELEERKALHERLVDYETKNGTVTEKYQHIKAIDVLNDAIEIVKRCGKERI